VLLLRLRCYLPSTSAIIAIVTVAYIALHSAAGHGFAGFSLATDIVIAVGLAGLAAGTIVISAVTIQRRRAATGACHACSHPCRGALVPLPERDARRWPHRALPVTVISPQTHTVVQQGATVTTARPAAQDRLVSRSS
jgi:hypothetical protein